MKGMVANIQRCSVHDGPGIRTTVFLKGCNLRCAWCHNPETISFEPQILFHPEKCIHCGMCNEGCFSGARIICGTEMDTDEVVAEILKDRAYYAQDGGVTISGGEPTCQPKFTISILEDSKKNGIHTAIETNLCCSKEVMKTVIEPCDLVMADLKIFDAVKHKVYTGVDNQRILDNLSMIEKPLILRTPVIEEINDSEEEIGKIAEFARKLPTLLYYELLPYHSLGLSKGAGQQEEFRTPTKEKMQSLAEIAKKICGQVRIAGRMAR